MKNTRFLWALVGSLVLLLCVITAAWYKDASALQTVAVAGDYSINKSDYLKKLEQRFGPRILDEMINHAVVFQEAERLGIEVDPTRIEQEVQKLKESYSSGENVETALREQLGTTTEELREMVRYQLLLQEIATRDISISEEEMRTYYGNHQDQYAQPAKVNFLQIVVASEEEAANVRQELSDGANFSTLAKERSLDSLTSANGGDVGWVKISDLEENLQAAVRSLEIKEDSTPIPIQEGFAIIRVMERKEAYQAEYDEVKDQIRRDIALGKVESLDTVLERLKQAVGVEIKGKQ
ncbi:peptidyl-prolyl cis-trans isomerase [Brevibacillus dissolubilis]|uniref:peptidyl-prolyl cis-trans isomerase n=1 Tax=Brevibacillus dissolubilis TaxID=1844116 RepID=UPI00111617E6|nr:peptidyl-prolyl cis-trans isomerase [Brevibacillus dissolubilis]